MNTTPFLFLAVVVVLLPALTSAGPASPEKPLSRSPRFFFNWGSSNCNGPCPPHPCDIDPAIIHGYCCGCAQLLDRVPITCPPQLTCPLQSEPLCSDYNFMMDCCC